MIKSTQNSAKNITDINDVVIGFDYEKKDHYQYKTNDVLDMMTNDFNELEGSVND